MDEKTIMNRLVLIGNGFDRAHGLKTSYKDFIVDYLGNKINEFIRSGKTSIGYTNYKDCLFELSGKPIFPFGEIQDHVKTIDDIKSFIQKYQGYQLFGIKFHSQILANTFNSLSNLNWVDIENEYYELLKRYSNNLNALKKLNDDFEYLGEKLGKYLGGLNIEKHEFASGEFPRLFSEKIKKEDVFILKKDINPKSIYFLNFNYTSTILKYRDQTMSFNRNLRYNFIHGDLRYSDNPMVFGFGDEFDKKFREFEELRNDELFRHIKSFKYSLTSNYHNLIRFIEAEKFQVYIIGHSCGLSDRTMLREIFEHNNCKSIKIFYHERSKDSNDFLEKTYNISRHFRDNGVMRKKLVPFEKSSAMPQPR